MNQIVLQTNNFTKTYHGVNAVDHVSMTVNKGEIYGFIGQNGAGKTTMFRLITSLIKPSGGGLALFGENTPAGLAAGHKRIGCMVEGPAFFAKLSAADNLEYYRIQRGIPDKTCVARALQMVKLADTGKKRYNQFSLGMKQRLGLALAIMGGPDLLILDEPINGLDPMGIIDIREVLKTLQREHGMTIIISSHILNELAQVATNFGIIHQGRLLREFTAKQLEEETRRSIVIKVDDAPAAAAVLQEKMGTTAFEVLPGNELRVYDFLDNPSEVSFQLNTNNVRVHSMTEQGVNLEEYFMQCIGQTAAR